MGAGQRILDGLRDAVDGNFASVTIDGQRWVKAPGWRPIETIPKSEDTATGCMWVDEWVLLFVPDKYGGLVIVGTLEADEWIARDNERACFELTTMPTHWMPLPTPPERKQGE